MPSESFWESLLAMVELDKLNQASSSINQLETQLEECRRQFQLSLTEGSKELSASYRKLKSSIEKSRPYFELFARRQQLVSDIRRNSEQYRSAQTEFEAAQSVLDSYSSVAKFEDEDWPRLEGVNRAIDKPTPSTFTMSTCLSATRNNRILPITNIGYATALVR
nr:unnamed protein product [Spirometra erinaceieuropaei]